MRVDTNSRDEGHEALEVVTGACTYLYHSEGGGFSSLLDKDGNDWIGYSDSKGPSGEYRGIPNMVFRRGVVANNHFHPGHTDLRGCETAVVEATPDRAVIESSVSDRWRVRWTFSEEAARLTVHESDPADPWFWFLYEGTPGGRFSLDDRILRSDGKDLPLSKKWNAKTKAVRWVAFRVPAMDRSLLLSFEADRSVPVSYYPMGEMTVFGFGRRLGRVDNLLTEAGTSMTIRLIETSDARVIAELASGGFS